ncbi:hypothetical protein [Coleofasciculus sp. FACHB-T130]|uniref:hypothetical protein n=1 Tax=Cyanophyceae TaxID=3028117 RepID=UPI0016833FC8|nr:hypothetical protein [Coleofasciculus sp. FACHB-T130]MBD1877777.1 hypothetical protein [Coleofasciculus sp. FACHB-T130]
MNQAKGKKQPPKDGILTYFSFFLLFTFYFLLPRSAKANELSALPQGGLAEDSEFAIKNSTTLPAIEQAAALERTPENSEVLGTNSEFAVQDSAEILDLAQNTIPTDSPLPSVETVTVEESAKPATAAPSLVAPENTAPTASPLPELREEVGTAPENSATIVPTASELKQSIPQTNAQQTSQQTSDGILAPTEVRILTPGSGVLGEASTSLVVQYHTQAQVQVSVNRKPLDAKTSTQIERDEAQNIITQVWYNVPLEKGENTITVQANNGTSASVKLTVKRTTAQTLEIAPVSDARIPADGRSLLPLAGRITNENGELIRENTIVTLTTSAGKFVGADEDKDRAGFQVIARGGQFTAQLQSGLEAQKVRIRAATEGNRLEGIRVGKDAHPTPINQSPNSNPLSPNLQQSPIPSNTQYPPVPPTDNPVAYTQDEISANTLSANTLETYTQVEFITNLRPSLVSGVVNLRIGPKGTNFWGPRREFLNPDTIDEGTNIDLSAAVFATGKVGEWLLTGAYNSARPLNQTCDGITTLFRGPQFCEQQYPIYGDSSTVDYLTPSKDSLYFRLERTSPVFGAEPDYVMWGDYNTTEFARASQLFSATSRQLHGFKGNYNLGNLQITALYSPDVEGFQRDTVAPNGTSGYYFLSRRLLVPGSESVFLETEEINRPGTVTSRKPLVRGPDYEIDYDRGTLLFRRPIFATRFDPFGVTQVQRIVVTYQHEGVDSEETNIYAGRAQYNFSQDLNRQAWVGGSYFRQDEGLQDFELLGADFLFPLGNSGQIVGEYARSAHNSPFNGDVNGNAYRLEAYGAIAKSILARAYYRSVEENFSNNATTSFTPGQTRYGANIAAQLSQTTSLTAGYDHEVNFGTAPLERVEFFDIFNPQPQPTPGEKVDNSLTTIRAGILQKFGASDLSLEYVNRSRDDRIGDTFDSNASQLVSRLNVALNDALTFRAQNELNLGNSSDALYPDRTTFGLDWAVMEGVALRLAHQFVDTRVFGRNSITSLDTLVEQKLGENTSITGRYSIISGFNTITGQGAVGLNHRWVVAPGLRVHLGYEHIFSDLFSRTAAGPRFEQPYATGQGASALGLSGGDAYSVGVEYTDNPNFQASARFEHRTGSGGSNTVISGAAAGKLSPSLTALVRYQQASASNQLLYALGDTMNVKLGMAYRNPNSDKWNGLLSYEYRRNPSTIPETLLLGSGTGYRDHIIAAEAIYAPSWRWEFYGKYAMRNSTTDLANNFSNSSTVFLAQFRTMYRLGYRWDVAGEARWIGQPDTNFNETGFALEAGYYVTPDLRASLGYSFGSVDDRDFSGYRSEGGVYFGLTLKVNELLGGFGRQKVSPPQQQESQVQPVAVER